MIVAVPLSLQQASAFVASLHRHHVPAVGDKYRIGAAHDGKLVGVVQVGRPVSRHLDATGDTLEVLRMCSDGTPNVCSFLYSAAARVAKELGYGKIITYILDRESGASLRAAGWKYESESPGGEWSCPSRPRIAKAPTCPKQRWARIFSTDKRGIIKPEIKLDSEQLTFFEGGNND